MDYNSFLLFVKSRRSIRKYSDQKVEHETIEQLIEAACWAPSNHNRQGWKFIVFENPQDRRSSIPATARLVYHMMVNKTVRSMMSEALRLRKVADLKEGAEQKHVGYLTFTGIKM